MDSVLEFEAFYRRSVRAVYGYTVARLGRDEAPDVVAEVFQAAAIAFGDGRGEVLSEAWVIAVARNKVIDRWRQAERRSAKSHLLHTAEVDTVAFPPDWSSDPRREAVLDALDSINPRHRRLLVLHHVEGMPIAEIAAAMGATPVSIESALARARRSFRRAYEPHRAELT